MALHKDLTGADLHEPKGIESAAADTVYVADGSGSGDWTSRLGDVLNLNQYEMTQEIDDISTADSSAYFYVPRTSRLRFINIILNNAITAADATVSILVNGVALPETLTVPYSGSTGGTSVTLNVSTTSTLLTGTIIQVKSDGGSTTAAKAFVTAGFQARQS